jgi:two-component system, OmpR family, response regulator
MKYTGVGTPENKQIEDSQLSRNELEQKQILISESEKELGSLFETYLSSLGINAKIANSGEKTMDRFFNSKKKDKPFDTILLDTHLSDPSGLDIAKRIRREKPHQKLVIVTTTPKEYLPSECLKIAGINEKDILTMPFRLSKLMNVLKN